MKKILFLYYLEPKLENKWNDGLAIALNILGSNGNFIIKKHNLLKEKEIHSINSFDFILGWGGFESPVDKKIKEIKKEIGIPTGLCIGGNAFPVRKDKTYDVLFYETTWFFNQVKWHPHALRAFGINSEIFYEYQADECSHYSLRENYPLYDYVSAGSLSNWKRHEKIINKPGNKLVIGQFQENNLKESLEIANKLILNGVAVSDQVDSWQLALIFNLSENVYVPANIIGGGERVVWEAKACGANVEIENDNPKLKSLLNESVKDEYWYYRQLKKGILYCL